MKTARFLADQLRRLDEAGVKTFVIRGNHDAESRITRELTLPESVKVFAGRAEAVSVGRRGLEAAVHGVSFAQQARARKPAAKVPPARSWKRQSRHPAYEPWRLAGSRPLRAVRAFRSS